jgi:hypothetical protein
MFTGFRPCSQSFATATLKTPRIHASLKLSGEHGGRHTACVNTPHRLMHTFSAARSACPGKNQTTKIARKINCYAHIVRISGPQSRGNAHFRHLGVSSFLTSGGCPGGPPRHRKSQPLSRTLAQSRNSVAPARNQAIGGDLSVSSFLAARRCLC